VVAVYGERVSAPALARLLPGTDAVEECLDAGVLVANGDGVAFRHELIRTAVEEAISPPRRAELHARIARTLASEARADAGRTAYHAAAADLDDLARRAAARAAETALRVDAFHEARRV